MPSSIVKTFADRTGKSEAEVEQKWDEAKAIVKKKTSEKDEKFYPTVVSILKKMLNVNEDVAPATTTSPTGATTSGNIAKFPSRLGDKPTAKPSYDGNLNGFPYFEIKEAGDYLKIAGDKRMNKRIAINDERVFKHVASQGGPFLVKHKDNYIKLTRFDLKGNK